MRGRYSKRILSSRIENHVMTPNGNGFTSINELATRNGHATACDASPITRRSFVGLGNELAAVGTLAVAER